MTIAFTPGSAIAWSKLIDLILAWAWDCVLIVDGDFTNIGEGNLAG